MIETLRMIDKNDKNKFEIRKREKYDPRQKKKVVNTTVVKDYIGTV